MTGMITDTSYISPSSSPLSIKLPRTTAVFPYFRRI